MALHLASLQAIKEKHILKVVYIITLQVIEKLHVKLIYLISSASTTQLSVEIF